MVIFPELTKASTYFICGTSVTAWASLTQWVVEVTWGALFALWSGKTFNAWAGSTVGVTYIRGDTLSSAFTN